MEELQCLTNGDLLVYPPIHFSVLLSDPPTPIYLPIPLPRNKKITLALSFDCYVYKPTVNSCI